MLLDFLLCVEDRERLAAPAVLVLDLDKVRDQPASMLMRWERECGYAIERAIGELTASNTPPAAATTVCVWLARKQMGIEGGGLDDDGHPEPFTALADLRTMKVGVRNHREPEAVDAVPPAGSPAA